ncbi:MAG: photosynthetic protein synthase I [Gammaproteobacteria bacterium]|nr:photosynthetic protein synthase I [Gammaproteobacteria bacterium]
MHVHLIVTTRRGLRLGFVAIALGVGLGLISQAVAVAEMGPLPVLKVNKARAELGKRLFFDKRVSGDAGISCATCHEPKHGFAHKDALSQGYPGNKHFRNAPGLINVAYKKVWLLDGRIGTNLNDVTREMITEDYIMNMDMRIMQERFKQDPVYVKMFEAAGLGEPSNGGVRKAIPEYLKTLVSHGAPFDEGTMSASAERGLKLFKGKAGCISCHSGPMFTDGKAHNTGVRENFDVWLDAQRHQAFIAYAAFMGVPDYMNLKRDPGAYVQKHNADGSGMGTFITPSLRELKYTGPYMHNGIIKTLADVVAYYNRGGDNDRNKDERMKALKLSNADQKDLVTFLLALSGKPLTGSQYVWQEAYPEEYAVIANWLSVSN